MSFVFVVRRLSYPFGLIPLVFYKGIIHSAANLNKMSIQMDYIGGYREMMMVKPNRYQFERKSVSYLWLLEVCVGWWVDRIRLFSDAYDAGTKVSPFHLSEMSKGSMRAVIWIAFCCPGLRGHSFKDNDQSNIVWWISMGFWWFKSFCLQFVLQCMFFVLHFKIYYKS